MDTAIVVVTRAAAEEEEAGAGAAWMEEVGDKHKYKCKYKYVHNSERYRCFQMVYKHSGKHKLKMRHQFDIYQDDVL